MSRTTYRGTPKAGLYTRLSVDDGYVDRESNSITSQKQMLTQFAEYHGIEIVDSQEQKETAQNAEKWVALIRQYSDLQELTAGIIRELITKIYVGDVRKVDGEKVQSVEIHYRFIGSLPSGAGK